MQFYKHWVALQFIESILCDLWLLYVYYGAEYIIEFEENHWEPGKWRPLLRVSGHQNSAPLSLYGHINYQFRVSAVNAIGRGQPSKPSERYKTPGARKKRPFHFHWFFTSCFFSQADLTVLHVHIICTYYLQSRLLLIQISFLTAPDRNPGKIKIEGRSPYQMDISWEVINWHCSWYAIL